MSDTGFKLSGAAKSLCIPFDQPTSDTQHQCFACDNKVEKEDVKWTLFGRSY